MRKNANNKSHTKQAKKILFPGKPENRKAKTLRSTAKSEGKHGCSDKLNIKDLVHFSRTKIYDLT